MIFEEIRRMIYSEQLRQQNLFIPQDITNYLQKIEKHAEFICDIVSGRCRGFVAFYCNDMSTKTAFITLVLVDPENRGLGLGKSLTQFVLNTAKARGFAKCRLEVDGNNRAAYAIYQSLGFNVVNDSQPKHIMEVDL